MFMNTLKNSNWLITGGTSGLGLALTEQLIEQGANVAVVARNAQRLAQIANRLPIIAVNADIANKEDIYKISGQVLAHFGHLDVLVNNASDLGPTPLRPLIDSDCETLEAVLQTNLIGPFRLTKAILPSMLLRQHGTIINISSDAAVSAYPNWGPYGISKAALDHLSRIWGEELREEGIRFLAVDPGDMNTPMHAAAIPDADVTKLKEPQTAARQLLDLVQSGFKPGAERKSL
jgi:NAD(P)-dependent dehydrogenase (short-subunit alcohol dehydrogenase family)